MPYLPSTTLRSPLRRLLGGQTSAAVNSSPGLSFLGTGLWVCNPP